MKMYNIYVEPHIAYGVLIYGASSKFQMDRIWLKQSIFRCIFNRRFRDHITDVMDRNLILAPCEMYILELTKFIYRCYSNEETDENISTNFIKTFPSSDRSMKL